jgi:hypothetical protein
MTIIKKSKNTVYIKLFYIIYKVDNNILTFLLTNFFGYNSLFPEYFNKNHILFQESLNYTDITDYEYV